MDVAYRKYIYYSFFILILIVVSCTLTNKNFKRIDTDEFMDNSTVLYETGLPVHAHLDDGAVVIFENGFYLLDFNKDSTIMHPNVSGAIRYSLDRRETDTIYSLDYSRVEFVEVVEKKLDGLAFFLSLPGVLVSTAITAVAIFGSCPTVYSMTENTAKLEAECFSYSINPRFEMQDVDRLEFAHPENGVLELELRNEALETHYINTFKVLTVDHQSSHQVLPKESGSLIDWKKELIEIGPEYQNFRILDKNDRDISHLLKMEDDEYYSSPQESVEYALSGSEINDWITMDINLPEDQEDLYLGFKMRSTLLNTVFLYDLLLDGQNFGSIDWTGEKSQELWYAYKFAKWYHKYFGLHIEVLKDGRFIEVEQLGDSGPIVWSKIGVRIPLFEGGHTKVRFRFLTDNWHIDWIGASLTGREFPDYITHEIFKVEGGDSELGIKQKVSTDDNQYLVTYPGHSYKFEFDVGQEDDHLSRSYFLQAKGYYIEWLRKDWLLADEGEAIAETVTLNNLLLRDLFEKWDCEKATMEDYFFETMIPVINGNENGE